MGRTLLLLVGLLVIGLVSGGCGAASDEPGPGLQRLTFEAATSPGPEPTGDAALGRVVRRLRPASEPEAWSFPSGVARAEPESERVELEAPAPGQDWLAMRTGFLDSARFDRLRLTGSFRGGGSLLATLANAAGVQVAFALVDLPDSEAPRTVELSAPRALTRGRIFRTLTLAIHGCSAVALESVELLDAPLAAQLPAPTEGPRTQWIDSRGRAAVAVITGMPLRAGLRVPNAAAGARLSLAFDEPIESAGEELDPPPELVLELWDGDVLLDTRRFRAPLASQRGDVPWRRVDVDLEAFAGRELEARLRVEAERAGGGPDGEPEPVALVVSEACVVVPGDVRPSVLLVTTDTHRGDHLGGAARSVGVATPNLDRLAERGARFERCFTQVNSTNASHVSLMTGRHPRDTGVRDNRRRLTDAAPTLAESFQRAGYRTWAVLSVPHLGGRTSGLDQGFDRMSGPPGVQWRAEKTVGEALSWLKEERDAPLFLWLHVFDAHWPYPPELEAQPVALGPGAPVQPRAEEIRDDELRGLFARAGAYEHLLGQYRAEITYLDRELKPLLEHERFADGVVAVVGDHGEGLGQHGIFFQHSGLYPDTLHVPLILVGPGVPRGARVETLVSQGDLGRTLLDLAGLESEVFPGRDLRICLPGWTGRERASGAGSEPHFALSDSARSASITSEGWHLVLQLVELEPSRGTRRFRKHSLQLFDLNSDPACLVDRAAIEPERTRSSMRALLAWLGRREELGWSGTVDLDAEQEARLEDLGYAESSANTEAELWVDDDCATCRAYRL